MIDSRTVKILLEGRRISKKNQRGVLELVRSPDKSYKTIAGELGIDKGRLFHLAGTIPGLRELRINRRRGRAA